jgi:uncharacterized protein (DUF1800 family)
LRFSPFIDFLIRYSKLSKADKKLKLNIALFIRSIINNTGNKCTLLNSSSTPLPSPTPSHTPTLVPSPINTLTPTKFLTPTFTFTPINTISPTIIPTVARTSSFIPTRTATLTATPTKIVTPNPTVSNNLDLDKYTGNFGRKEAFTLYERFAFGASPEEIDQAVAEGLEATVNKLMTIKNEKDLDITENDIRCDNRLKGESDDNQNLCSTGRLTEFNGDGVVRGIVYRILSSPNPFYHKLFIFLHDERMTASSYFLDEKYTPGVIEHIDMLRKAAFTGNYYEFMKEYVTDEVGHLIWLDGRSSIGTKPNENFAREFWELGTIGTIDLLGNSNYGILDIARSAMAFSGWDLVDDTIKDKNGENYTVFNKRFIPERHAQREVTIFNGTAFEAKVKTHLDVLNATFNHPRTAEHMAEELWREYVSYTKNDKAILELAKIIRDNDYNLHPALKKMMLSKALYAANNRKTMIKLPTDFYFGLFRTFRGTFNPYNSPYQDVENSMYFQGMQLLRPKTVFGWNEKVLTNQSVLSIIRNELQENFKFLIQRFDFNGKNFKSFIHTDVSKPKDLIEKLSRYLNIDLNQEQIILLEKFANNRASICNNGNRNSLCQTGVQFTEYPSTYNPKGDNYNGFDVSLGILYTLLTMPEYYLK